jgi:HTH-type transcriptional regulator/antitoxin HigA
MYKVIITDDEYQVALNALEAFIDQDPDIGTPEADKLDLLTLLIEDYEEKITNIDLPDPISAIRFRMDQQRLTQRDLIPFIGSRSKVSEILSGKRPLTLSMIRALNDGLGIPAKVLIQDSVSNQSIDWSKFPVREMAIRGWIEDSVESLNVQYKNIIQHFFSPLDKNYANAVLLRKTCYVRSARKFDEYALAAWTARVLLRSNEFSPKVPYNPETLTLSYMQDLVRLSPHENGPLLVRDALFENGIILVVEKHLPRTHLDGAAIMLNQNNPVIGLTLRYDRIDNFWFCLMHELAHLSLHFDQDDNQFFDDLEFEDLDDPREIEADNLAGEALIPQAIWERSAASKLRSPTAVHNLANKLQIHPAIVAGRMRHEFKAYRLFNNLVGHHEVHKLFTEIDW